jgi:hypothetical protein
MARCKISRLQVALQQLQVVVAALAELQEKLWFLCKVASEAGTTISTLTSALHCSMPEKCPFLVLVATVAPAPPLGL